MSSRTVTKMALVVCILCAFAVSAQTQSYLLRSEGAVSVNGIAVPSTALVSDGDVIQTGKGSSAKIAAPGMAMLLGENSRVAVANGKLAVDHGSASIANSRGQVSTVGASSSPNSFTQLLGPSTSNVCRTAAICYCKTAAHCPNKDIQ